MATILVADDNRANREALAALLEHAGHEVVRAADGREALALAREKRPELVISDVLMPMMDGYELARRLKADPVTANTALMFYTAYFGGQDAQVLTDVRRFQSEVQTRRAKLRSDRARQAQVVSERAARKRSNEGQLAERQRLLASVKDEIVRMEAAERRRQAQLEAQARARFAAEAAARQSARQQALELSSSPSTDYPGDATLASSSPSTPAPPAKYGGVVGIAMQYLGTPYVYGGASPGGPA